MQDSSLSIIGFQASYDKSERGFYLFNHLVEKDRCNSTIAVNVEEFMSLYKGSMYEDVRAGSDVCSGHCVRVDDLAKCDVPCRNAIARDIMLDAFRVKK